MPEITIRVAGPAAIVVLEVEAPTRTLTVTGGVADAERLGGWIEQSALRQKVVSAAHADQVRQGGRRRGEVWAALLAAEEVKP